MIEFQQVQQLVLIFLQGLQLPTKHEQFIHCRGGTAVVAWDGGAARVASSWSGCSCMPAICTQAHRRHERIRHPDEWRAMPTAWAPQCTPPGHLGPTRFKAITLSASAASRSRWSRCLSSSACAWQLPHELAVMVQSRRCSLERCPGRTWAAVLWQAALAA